MDLCKEKFYGTENLREYRSQSRSSSPMEGLVDAKPKSGALNLMGMEEEGETDGGEYEEHDDSIEDSVTPPVTPTSDSDALASQSSPLPCRNYRVVSNTCADSTSKKPLRLTLRAASPKEESPSSAIIKQSTPTGSYPRMSPEPFQRIVTPTGNGLSPLKIVTSLSSASSSPSGTNTKTNLFFQSRVSSMEHVHTTRPTAANVVHRNRSRPSRTRSVNKKPRRTTATPSAVPQRKPRTPPEPSGRPSPRRSNGKRSSGGPTLNGYGVPASIEGMSSMKDFINHENFLRFKPDQQRTLASMLPRMDIVEDEFGNVTISDSALKNEYFTKSLKEYLNKGYRVAAMTSQRYPLSTGHNTRQRRRNEFQGVDLSPKDEWKMTYFEKFWGEKTEARESLESKGELNEACKSQLGLKQPVVKLTRTDSVGSDECALKSGKLEPEELETPAEETEPLAQLELLRTAPPNKTRKRRQREPRDVSTTANDPTVSRKRRRKQTSNGQLLRGNQLCMTLPPSDNLSSPAGALAFVDEHGKSTASAKTGSASGPSNNSSSSPSTYGETSPPNEELGTPAEFIKPRPPPPQSSIVSRDKPMVNQYFQFASSVNGGPGGLGSSSGLRHAVSSQPSSTPLAVIEPVNCNSRLGGKTVGEQRRELACIRPLPKPAATATSAPISTSASTASAAVVAASAASSTAATNTPRVRRRYATAARHFEKQLEQKEAEAGADKRRCKKSHDTRLKRLRKRNSLSTSTDEGSAPCGGIKNSTQGSTSKDAGPSDSASNRDSGVASSGSHSVPASSISGSSSSSSSSNSISSGNNSNAAQRLKASISVLRTSDGVSFVFRDRICPVTLASVLRRHPKLNFSVSFFVPCEELLRLQAKLKAALANCNTNSHSTTDPAGTSPEHAPRVSTCPVLRWVQKNDANLVYVTFEEEVILSEPAECKPESRTSPLSWSRDGDAALDSGQRSGAGSLAWPSRSVTASTSVPSVRSETACTAGKSAPSSTHGISPHDSQPGDFLRETESQVFRGQLCSERRSLLPCPPPAPPPHTGPQS